MNATLDASAIIAYLDEEPGGAVVAALVSDPTVTCYAHSFNLCEVYYYFARRANRTTAREAIADLRADGVIFRRDFSVSFWQAVGDLKASGGVSLPDCICIVLASRLDTEAITADRNEFRDSCH